MAYITGTVTDANPGPALHALMAPALTTAGYTLVDTVVISTRTHKIWKSAAASNSLALDWYLDVVYTTTGAGTFAIAPFEYFDPATDLGYRGLHSTNSAVIEGTYFSRYGATGQTLENVAWLTATGTYTSYQVPLTTGSFGYWISVTPERVISLLSNVSDRLFFAGFYTPDPLYAAKAGSNLYPLTGAMLTGITTSSTTAGNVTAGLTRMPPATALGGNGWGFSLYIPGLSNLEMNSYPMIPTTAQTVYPWTAVPIPMFVGTSAGTNAVATRWGTVRDVLTAATSISIARGDTCTVGGQPYVFSSQSGTNQALLFRAV